MGAIKCQCSSESIDDCANNGCRIARQTLQLMPRTDSRTFDSDEWMRGWKAASDAAQERVHKLESMLRQAGYSDAQIEAGTPYVEVMGG